MTKSIRIALPGAAGRMGQAITEAVAAYDDIEIITTMRRGDDAKKLVVAKPDVIVDFTSAAASTEHAAIAADGGIPIVIGATGHDAGQINILKTAAKKIPLVLCANGAIGVSVLGMLAGRAAAMLPAKTWDAEIHETHHRNKEDAPSGTALALGKAVAEGRGIALANVAEYARHGMTGARKEGSIGFAVSRGGDVVGEHRVIFYADGEEIELRYRATSRRVYATGALLIAMVITRKKPGFYTTADILEDLEAEHAAKK